MNAPWRHHYVAQMQLARFADAGGLLHHFDKTNPQKGIRHDGPKGIFYERHLYSTIDATGAYDTSAEDEFSKIESAAAPVIDKIVASARARKLPGLTRQERSDWDAFVYHQHKRVPDLMDKYGPQFDGMLQHLVADFENDHRPLTAEEKALMADPDEQARIKRAARVHTQIAPSTMVTDVMATRGLAIAVITDPKKAYIIGSHPVVKLTLPGKTHLSHPEVELWLPIASDVMVSPFGARGTEKMVAIPDHLIRTMNVLLTKQSKVIAGRSKALIASLINPR